MNDLVNDRYITCDYEHADNPDALRGCYAAAYLWHQCYLETGHYLNNISEACTNNKIRAWLRGDIVLTFEE